MSHATRRVCHVLQGIQHACELFKDAIADFRIGVLLYDLGLLALSSLEADSTTMVTSLSSSKIFLIDCLALLQGSDREWAGGDGLRCW